MHEIVASMYVCGVNRWCGLDIATCNECVMSLGNRADVIMARCIRTQCVSVNWEVMLQACETVLSLKFQSGFLSALTCSYMMVQ